MSTGALDGDVGAVGRTDHDYAIYVARAPYGAQCSIGGVVQIQRKVHVCWSGR